MARRSRLVVAFVATGTAWLGLTIGGAPGVAMAGTPVPGAPNCPMFPADNVWNTPIANLPVDAHSAAWLASMNAGSTNLHPDFGPSGDPSNPYGMPYTVVSPSHPLVPISFQYADESDPGPYPFGADTPIEGGQQSTGDRHAIMVNPATCTLYELYDARVQLVGLDGRLRGDLEPQLQRAAPGGVDVGGRGRPADPARAPALRRGAVGRHHPRHPDDGRGDGHLVPLAGPPRGRDVVRPEPAAHGGPVPAEGRLRHLGLLAPGPGGAARHAAVRADPGRQRLQLVLRGYGGPRTGRSPWSTS